MEIYAFRAGVFAGPPIDLSGFDVEATDGHIGRVDESTYDKGAGCLVVDTGFWIFGKKRLVPAGVVRDVDTDEKKVFVSMTKEQVKHAPDYDEASHQADEDRYHDDVGSYYEPYGGSSRG